MPIRTFCIPIRHGEPFETDLNAFLGNHKILNVDRRFVDDGEHSYWTFCVDYLVGKPLTSGTGRGSDGKPRIDYREILPPEQFVEFSALRNLRKEIANAEGIALYAVFTNEQLAEMVRRQVTSRTEMQQIPGIGEARIAKYGDRVLAFLSQAPESSVRFFGIAGDKA